MFPALAPVEARLVNDRSLSIYFEVDNVHVSIMVRPDGVWSYHHIYMVTKDHKVVTIHSA